MTGVKNPLLLKGKVEKIKEFKTSRLVREYAKMNTDVKRIFGNLKKIELYQCAETGYQFFVPSAVVGDSLFYGQLSRHDWYYSSWRWEHEVSSKLLSVNDRVLEVGCGSGFFLEKIKSKVRNTLGLELNEAAIKEGVSMGLKIKNESIQDFAKNNQGKYSVVCSYQVLEHVIDVGSFLDACLMCLKPGGRLLISVPNNSYGSLIVNDDALNMPPHHMGRWNAESLANIARIYDLKIEKMLFEPAGQDFQGVYRKYTGSQIISRHPLFYKIFKPFLKPLINYFVNINSSYLQGHSVFVEYRKK